MGGNPKIGEFGTPILDGENNGKPLLKWMIWGVPLFSETPILYFVPSCHFTTTILTIGPLLR